MVAKGAHSAYEMGKREHFLQLIDWSGLAGVVKERVEVRLFWRVPRVRLARLCGDSWGERIKTTTRESNGVYRVLCCYSVAMPWLTDRGIDDE